MKERKNLENLFQEKFENFDINPPENAWQNIEMRLKEKKKRRIILFWWKLSGVAALLLIGFFIGQGVSNSKTENAILNKNDIVKGTKVEKSNEMNVEKEVVKSDDKLQNTSGESSSENTVNANQNSDLKGLNNLNTVSNASEKSIASGVENNRKQINSDTKIISNSDKTKRVTNKNLPIVLNNSVATTKNLENSTIYNNSKNKSNEGVIEENKQNSIENKTANNNLNQKNKELFTENKTNNTIVKEMIFKNNIIEKEKNSVAIENNSDLKNKENIVNSKENKIVTKENEIKIIEEIKKIDSTKIAIVEPNALEELLKEKEKKTNEEPKLNRWQLSTNVAPIYFSSTSSNGSPLDSKLANNQKSYETNLSYGLGVNYAVTKKLKVRTGINTVSFNYNTNDITFYQSNNASKLKNLDVNENGLLVQIENKSSGQGNPELTENGTNLKKFDSSLNQKLGYIEVPLEMSYALVNKKFGVEILGGLSTLFLNQNQVYLESAGVKMEIGEASNLNAVHFSGNLGLGLKYSVFKRISVKVEPVIKYQLNTFSTDSGSFKPYILGIYSGLSYTF